MSEKEFENFTTSIIIASIENNNMIDKDMKNYCINYITSLQQKVEQLENIRKECIDYIKDEIKDMPLNGCKQRLTNLLNILNKGSDKE